MVVNSTGAGMSANSFCWFCHAVPKLPLRCGVFLQLRIAVGWQHFAVRVDIHALARRLLQQQLQVVEIMAGDDDERPLLHRQRTVTGVGVP